MLFATCLAISAAILAALRFAGWLSSASFGRCPECKIGRMETVGHRDMLMLTRCERCGHEEDA